MRACADLLLVHWCMSVLLAPLGDRSEETSIPAIISPHLNVYARVNVRGHYLPHSANKMPFFAPFAGLISILG
jgi:hypothetical protein